MTDKSYEIVTLDVSRLPAPEPMTKIIQALAALTSQQFLLVHHRREPFPLYEKLVGAGWLYGCNQQSAEQFDIYIYKKLQQQYVAQFFTIEAKVNQ
jgi:hypothetical protein